MKRSPSPALRWGSIALVLVMTSVFANAGCGGAPAANMGADAKVASSPEQAPAPQNLGEAEAQFASAERGVFGALGHDKLEAQGGFAQPPPGQTVAQSARPSATTTAASEAAPPPPPKDEDRSLKEGEAKAATGAYPPQAPMGDSAGALSSSPCETACRALASMNRAAMHICSLAGDDSDHCANARERVRAATERVRQSCSECAG